MTSTDASSPRSRAKSDRRSQLVAAAERLFAEHGYLAVRLEDIGAAAGVSGPAIYRHFPNKEALLVELLVGISTRLLAGATQVATEAGDADTALENLVDFHLDFAFGEPDLIRIQDRDLGSLPAAAKRQVRRKQRAVCRDMGRGVAPPHPATVRGRRPVDGARGVRPAELDAARRQTRSHEFGRGRPAYRPQSDDDRGADLGRTTVLG